MSEEVPDRDIERVRKALDNLGEYFDTVHIFATRHDPAEEEGTITIQTGIGNWYARYGQIKEWIIKRDSEASNSVIEDE